jgi:WhiB family redox-sensing transcriptional regulator
MAGWRDQVLCREVDPELFFPVGTGRLAQRQTAQAKAVCAGCPVMAQCLAFALTHLGEGIAGGTTPAERTVLRGQPIKRAAASVRREMAVQLRARGLSASVIGQQIGLNERSVYRLLRDCDPRRPDVAAESA